MASTCGRIRAAENLAPIRPGTKQSSWCSINKKSTNNSRDESDKENSQPASSPMKSNKRKMDSVDEAIKKARLEATVHPGRSDMAKPEVTSQAKKKEDPPFPKSSKNITKGKDAGILQEKKNGQTIRPAVIKPDPTWVAKLEATVHRGRGNTKVISEVKAGVSSASCPKKSTKSNPKVI
jgi:hypothetical protein